MFVRPWNGCQQIEFLAYTQCTEVITICSGLYKRQSSYLLLPPMGVPASCIPIVYRIVKYDVRACARSNIFTLHAEKKQRLFLKEKAYNAYPEMNGQK